jgi:glycosyltransferase involved in cell wall biosynthesis
MKTAPRTYVLAPVHNRRAITEKFIRLLLAQTYANWHLVLIDDGSSDDTQGMARSLVPPNQLTVLRGAGKWWWAGSLHQGYLWLLREKADPGDIVLTMNDDTEFDADFIAKGVCALRPHSLLMARCYHQTGMLDEVGVFWDWWRLGSRGVTDPAAVNCFATRGLFLSVGDFLELGGFHPVLLPHYLSDYEFTMRAHRRGFSLTSSPDVFLRFDDSPELTGIRVIEDGVSPFEEMRRNLSMRSTSNPIHWSGLVLLGSPKIYIPTNLIRVWWRFVSPIRRRIDRIFFAPIRRLVSPVRRFLGRVKRKVKREWAARSEARR